MRTMFDLAIGGRCRIERQLAKQRLMSTAKRQESKESYIPPLRFHALTPAYDALIRWTCAENEFREVIVRALEDHPFSRVIDVGCGTGSLLMALHRRFPTAHLTGLDADESSLRLAAGKLAGAGAVVDLLPADARHLPFPNDSADAITCSLFFHHLDDETKVTVLREIRRCLSPRGLVVIADWDRASSVVTRTLFHTVRILDGFAVTRAHARGEFQDVIIRAGLAARPIASIVAPLGQITVWSCRK